MSFSSKQDSGTHMKFGNALSHLYCISIAYKNTKTESGKKRCGNGVPTEKQYIYIQYIYIYITNYDQHVLFICLNTSNIYIYIYIHIYIYIYIYI